MFNIFEELSWQQFSKLPNIVRLPLNEQVTYYNQYLFDLSVARQNWIDYQNKGPRRTTPTPPVEEGFLLQEDLFDLLQETGDKIIITT
jgi:hypothetical protein